MARKQTSRAVPRTGRAQFAIDEIGVIPARNAKLADRVCQFIEHLPSERVRPSREMTECVFAEARALAAEAGALAQAHHLRMPHRLVEYDYSFPTYAEFEAQVDRILKEMEVLPDEKFLFLLPPGPLLANDAGTGVLLCNAQDDASTPQGGRKWIAKLFAALGINEIYQAILEVLDEGWPQLMKQLGIDLSSKQWKKAAATLGRILDLILSKPFLKKLGEKLGAQVAAKVIGKVAAKFVPFLGWALLIGAFIWAIAEEFL